MANTVQKLRVTKNQGICRVDCHIAPGIFKVNLLPRAPLSVANSVIVTLGCWNHRGWDWSKYNMYGELKIRLIRFYLANTKRWIYLAGVGKGKYLSTSSVKLNKPIWNGKLEFMREREGAYRFWRENIREIRHLEFIDLDRMIKIKWIFRK